MRFKEDSIFLLLPTNAAICENFLLPKYIRPKISALTVRPRNQKSEFSPLFSLLSGCYYFFKPHVIAMRYIIVFCVFNGFFWKFRLFNFQNINFHIKVAPKIGNFWWIWQHCIYQLEKLIVWCFLWLVHFCAS